jgi:hypothetical protein
VKIAGNTEVGSTSDPRGGLPLHARLPQATRPGSRPGDRALGPHEERARPRGAQNRRGGARACGYCPKLCREACRSRTRNQARLTPWGKMTLTWYEARSDLARIAILPAGVGLQGCLACRDAAFENPVVRRSGAHGVAIAEGSLRGLGTRSRSFDSFGLVSARRASRIRTRGR